MEVPSTEVQNNFGRYLKFACFEDVVITRNGKRIAVIKQYEGDPASGNIVAEKNAAYNPDDRKISYEDFIKLTEQSENRYEYIDGEVYLLASPSYTHQAIAMEMSYILYDWFKGKKCRPLTAPFDVTLSRYGDINVVQPDIIVICDTENITEKGKYTGVPTLAVEIMSDETRHKDMLKKFNLYTDSGIKEYWIISPSKREVYLYYYEEHMIKENRVYRDNDILRSIAFDQLEMPLAKIFAV